MVCKSLRAIASILRPPALSVLYCPIPASTVILAIAMPNDAPTPTDLPLSLSPDALPPIFPVVSVPLPEGGVLGVGAGITALPPLVVVLLASLAAFAFLDAPPSLLAVALAVVYSVCSDLANNSMFFSTTISLANPDVLSTI